MNPGRKAVAVGAGAIAAMAIYVLAAGGEERETPKPATLTLRDLALRHARTRLGEVRAESLTTPAPDPTGSLSGTRVSCLAAARFPEFYTPTDDERDLAMWTRVFRHRVEQILNGGPCPE